MFLSLVSGIHSGVIHFSFGVWLKESGVHIIYLGLFNLIFLPFCLKMFWVPFLENRTKFFKHFENRKGFLILFELLISIFTYGLYWINPATISIQYLMIFGICYAALIATKEALAIAYQMETIKSNKWGSSEGKVMSAFYIGFWIGGILLFSLASFISWNNLFLILSGLLFSFFVMTIFIPESRSHIKSETMIQNRTKRNLFIEPYKELIQRNKKILLPLILFIALYRLQDRLLMSVTNYFFIDLAFSKTEFLIGKTLGIICMILGGVLGSLSVKKKGYKWTMKFGMFWHGLAASLFLIQSLVPKSHVLFYFTMFFEKITRGFEGSVFFTYQMIFCSKYFIMTQLSMLLALDKITGLTLGSVSGYIVHIFGWSWFFGFSFIGMIPAMLFLRKLPSDIGQANDLANNNQKKK